MNIWYPKVGKIGYSWLNTDILVHDETVVLEKLDGSNGRFMVYDEQFQSTYNPDFLPEDPTTGDVIIGTKKSPYGTVESVQKNSSVPGFVQHLADAVSTLDSSQLLEAQSEYGSPLLFFVENMVPHSIRDYYNGDTVVPEMVGFDICDLTLVPSRQEPNPANQSWRGFLSWDSAKSIFEDIGVTPMPEYEDVSVPIDPEAFEVPQSHYADRTAEGVVLRNDTLQSRLKLVTPEFEEENSYALGFTETEDSSGEEIIVARYCTNARIRKQIATLMGESSELSLEQYDPSEDREAFFKLNEDLRIRVLEDMWSENWQEIKDMSISFTPSEIKPLVAQRCIAKLKQLHSAAETTGKHPLNIFDMPSQ